MAESDAYKVKIPPEVVKFLKKDAPKNAKLMAARGLVPMAPDVLLSALFLLSSESDVEVSQAANENLAAQPDNVLLNLLAKPMHPKILDFYARHKTEHAGIVETILLNKLTLDDTYLFLAPTVDEKTLTIIADNQQRLLRTPDIAEALRKNPQAPRSIIDRIISFLRLNGVILEGVQEELTPQEVKSILAEDDEALLSSIYEADLTEDLDDLSSLLLDDDDDVEVKEEKVDFNDPQILRKLDSLSIAEKIKLAIKGNKEVRTTLIKSPNKLICTAVIKSPKIKESEVVGYAQMRSLHDEVLRIISRNPEWMKNYKIKHSLINNPKCPIAVALNFMSHLRANDLGMLAKNRNVSQQVRNFAKQFYQKKRK